MEQTLAFYINLLRGDFIQFCAQRLKELGLAIPILTSACDLHVPARWEADFGGRAGLGNRGGQRPYHPFGGKAGAAGLHDSYPFPAG